MRLLSAVPLLDAEPPCTGEESCDPVFERTLTALDGTVIEMTTESTHECKPCSVIRLSGPGAGGDATELVIESVSALQALVESGALDALLAAHTSASLERWRPTS